jgi:hypothetical protein
MPFDLLPPTRSDVHDPYERYHDVSDTPILDLIVGLATLCLVLGGGLAAVYAIGYFSVGRAALAWPLVGTFTVLAMINVAVRVLRSSRRRH